MSLNARSVEAAIRNSENGYSDAMSGYAYKDYENDTIVVDGEEYPIKVVETDPGGEGHGEYVYFVIQVGDEFFRQEGYYASHYGTDWDGPFEKVTQVEKTVKVWERTSDY